MAVSQLKIGIILNYVIIGLNALVGLFYTPYMLQELGQTEYGLYSLVASIIAYLTILDFGFGSAIVRFTSKFRAENKNEKQYQMYGMFFLLYCLIGIIAFSIGLSLYFNIDVLFDATMTFEELAKARILLLILLINLLVTFPMSIYSSIIIGYEEFLFQKAIQILRISMSTIVMIVILKIGYKAVGLVIVQSIFNILALTANAIYAKKKLKIKIIFSHIDKFLLTEIALYSFWIFLDSVTGQFYWNSGQWILGIYSGTVMIAIFSLALQLKSMYYLFSSAISSVFLPKITRMVALHASSEELSSLFIKTGRIQYIIISFILTCFVIFGQSFIALWVGKDYEQAYYIVLLIFFATAIPLIQNLAASILMAQNKMKKRSLIVFLASMISVLLAFPFAKKWGAIGCSIPIFISVVITYGPILNLLYKNGIGLDVKKFWIEIAKMSIIPFLYMLIGSYLIRHIVFTSFFIWGISVLLFTMIYAPIFYIFSMNEYEKDLVKSAFRKVIYLNRR